jgi:hypothetical protein
MMLPTEQHRIICHLAQQSAVGRHEVSEAMLTSSFGMQAETVRHHVDLLEGNYISVRKRMETQNRWLTLLPAGEDYAREHGII